LWRTSTLAECKKDPVQTMSGSEMDTAGVLIIPVTAVESFVIRPLDVFVEFVVSDICYVTFLRSMYQSSIPDVIDNYQRTKCRFGVTEPVFCCYFGSIYFCLSLSRKGYRNDNKHY